MHKATKIKKNARRAASVELSAANAFLTFFFCVLGSVATSTLFTSCDDEEDGTNIPSVTTDLVMAKTDGEGYVESIILDNGVIYSNLTQHIFAQSPNTEIRCVAAHSEDENGIRFYSMKSIFASNPTDTIPEEKRVHDPVKVTSAWKGNAQWANLQIGIMTTHNGKHSLAYSIDSIVGTTKHISLLHHRDEKDAESYTEKAFISLPLHPEETETNATVLHIFTYDGWREFEF